MNTTTELIISRLPKRPVLSPLDISRAVGMATASSILTACKNGEIQANIIGHRYLIARDEAIRWLTEQEGKL